MTAPAPPPDPKPRPRRDPAAGDAARDNGHATDATLSDEGLSGEPPPPACVLCFNAHDPSGAGGLSGDIATVAAMGAHCLPVVTAILMRDTAELYEQVAIDDEAVHEQARTILEDVSVNGFKVGFLGSPDTVAAVAEVLSDYADAPVVTYLPDLSWVEESELQPYLDAWRELILPATELLVGNHKTLTDVLLPDWEQERPASARELAVAAGEHGCSYVLVTGVMLPSKGSEQFIDNVLAAPQGALTGEKFERMDTAFVGAGDTLAAALAALLSAGVDLQPAVGEALTFLDESLDAGFRPGMGNVVPDRFFWALPPEGEEGLADGPMDGNPPDGPAGGGSGGPEGGASGSGGPSGGGPHSGSGRPGARGAQGGSGTGSGSSSAGNPGKAEEETEPAPRPDRPPSRRIH